MGKVVGFLEGAGKGFVVAIVIVSALISFNLCIILGRCW